MIETERKYLDVDFDKLRSRLKAHKAIFLGAHFESNIILDNPDKVLLNDKMLLRLRLQEWQDKSRCVLTLKRPAENDLYQSLNKVREELECEIGSCEMALRIFAQLGFEPVARYEKVREEWELDIAPRGDLHCSCALDLDELSFARIVEVEAAPECIEAAAAALGLDNYESSSLSYHELHQLWREKNNLPALHDIIFSSGHKKNLRENLGLPN